MCSADSRQNYPAAVWILDAIAAEIDNATVEDHKFMAVVGGAVGVFFFSG